MNEFQASDQSLDQLRKNFVETAESYIVNYNKLSGLMDAITRGDITGGIATEILNKYESKKDIFDKLKAELEKAVESSEKQITLFNNMYSNVEANIR